MSVGNKNLAWGPAPGRLWTSFVIFSSLSILWIGALQAEEPVAVVVKEEARTCSDDLSGRFLEELEFRISTRLSVVPVDEGTAHWVLRMSRVGEDSCEIQLESGEKSSSFLLPEDAENLEIVSIVTRLAWIVDGSPGTALPLEEEPEESEEPEEVAELEAPEPEEEPEEPEEPGESAELEASELEEESEEPNESAELEAPELDELEEVLEESAKLEAPELEEEEQIVASVDPDPVLHQSFSLDVVGGAMWLPEAGVNLMMVRARAGWQPWSKVKFGLAGRLPIGRAEMRGGGIDIGYSAWSVDLMTAFTTRVGQRWTANAGGGVRRTTFAVTAEERSQDNRSQEERAEGEGRIPGVETPVEDTRRNVTGGSDSTVQNALSPWAVLASGSVNYSLTQIFALGLETTVAMSPTDRVIRDDQQIIADLGRFEFDILLGLELRF